MFSRFSIMLVLLMAALLSACCGTNPAATAVPTTAAPVEQATATTDNPETTSTVVSDTSAEAAACTLLNLNDVTEDQLLATMPDFSNRMVREFFEYRPYVSIQQFRREIGKYVDDAQVTAWEAYVYVPVAINDADAETLQQLPGVDEAIAETLIAGRPYADNQAFLDALSASVTADQATAAGCYLISEA